MKSCHSAATSHSILIVYELEAPWLFLDSVFDNFCWLSQADVSSILDAIRIMTALLGLCPPWPVKAGGAGTWEPVVDIINLSIKAVVVPFLKISERVAAKQLRKFQDNT